MKYKKILCEDGSYAGHTTIRGLKLAIRQKKIKEGIFKCHCPKGNVHKWEIKQSGTHTCAGHTVAKGKIGKGIVVINYAAKYLGHA